MDREFFQLHNNITNGFNGLGKRDKQDKCFFYVGMTQAYVNLGLITELQNDALITLLADKINETHDD